LMSLERDFPHALPFRLITPQRGGMPYLFNSPHSGRNYPATFRQMSCLDAFDLRLSEDRFVDHLFAGLVNAGATVMLAEFPRAYLDVNREACELDASMFADRLPDFVPSPTLRVAAGFGCVPRLVAADKPIYDHKLPSAEALGRITSLYRPYHRCLEAALQALKNRYGYAILIDCHSMPGQSRVLEGEEAQPDMILGDVYGRSCSAALTNHASAVLEEMGYHVRRNQPYAGGYITCHYGQPASNIHAMQIEINRDLYLDPYSLEPHDGFAPLCAHMLAFGRDLMQLGPEIFLPYKNAAE